MNDYVNRTDLLLMMEKRADFDSQPRACKRMVSVVRNYPAARAVPESVFLAVLSWYTRTPEEREMWKQKAGIA